MDLIHLSVRSSSRRGEDGEKGEDVGIVIVSCEHHFIRVQDYLVIWCNMIIKVIIYRLLYIHINFFNGIQIQNKPNYSGQMCNHMQITPSFQKSLENY